MSQQIYLQLICRHDTIWVQEQCSWRPSSQGCMEQVGLTSRLAWHLLPGQQEPHCADSLTCVLVGKFLSIPESAVAVTKSSVFGTPETSKTSWERRWGASKIPQVGTETQSERWKASKRSMSGCRAWDTCEVQCLGREKLFRLCLSGCWRIWQHSNARNKTALVWV